MNFRRSRPDDPVQELWKRCFDEDGAVFFRHDHRVDCTLVAAEDDKPPVAMLHYTPRTVSMGLGFGMDELSIPAAYVLGICTLPEYRGQGLATQLIQQMFVDLRRRRIPLAFLLPAEPSLSAFYTGMGFRAMGLKPDLSPLYPVPVLPAATMLDYDGLNDLYISHFGINDSPYVRREPEHWKAISEMYRLCAVPGRYQIWDEGLLMEDSDYFAAIPSPVGAHVKIIDWDYFLLLSEQMNRPPLAREVCDPHTPWNERGGVISPEMSFFGHNYMYANALYNTAGS